MSGKKNGHNCQDKEEDKINKLKEDLELLETAPYFSLFDLESNTTTKMVVIFFIRAAQMMA